MVTNEIKSDRVVLQLLGIDKKWVKSSKGEWVDKRSLKKNKSVDPVLEEEVTGKKRWWKFWG